MAIKNKPRAPKLPHDYDERIMPRHKSKVAAPPDDRDVNSPRHRSIAIRPHERERDRDGTAHHQRRSSHALGRLMSQEEAQRVMHTLFKQVKETTSFFVSFKDEYGRDVRSIEAYAGHGILKKLWERKIKYTDDEGHSGKSRPKDENVCPRPAFHDISNRLWHSLTDAYEGARSHPSGENDSLARKLDAATKEVGRLLMEVQSEFKEMDNLIDELKLLRLVLELGGAGTASNDDGASQRHGIRGAGHGHQRNSSLDGEDARYGGLREDSGSEDNDRHDEQYGEHLERPEEREESQVHGDEEGQGLCRTDQAV